MDDKDKKELSNELLAQFHGQYAENYNSSASTLVAFLTAIAAAFAIFGYTFQQFITGQTATAFIIFKGGCVVVNILFTLIAIIAIELGWHSRRDQFIIYKIRRKKMLDSEYREIFPDNYIPDGKGFFSFIPGIFNIFWVVSVALMICVIVVEIYCSCCYLYCCHFTADCCQCIFCFVTVITALSRIILPLIVISFLTTKYSKYKQCKP